MTVRYTSATCSDSQLIYNKLIYKLVYNRCELQPIYSGYAAHASGPTRALSTGLSRPSYWIDKAPNWKTVETFHELGGVQEYFEVLWRG